VLRWCLIFFYGGCCGVLVASGVFTVLLAIGLTPRFAGKTGTADKILFYENSIIAGTVLGALGSVSDKKYVMIAGLAGQIILLLIGFLIGCFVGCLALAIAEMLDSIPIFSRRIGFRHGLGIVVIFVALGKCAGSLAYFLLGLGNV